MSRHLIPGMAAQFCGATVPDNWSGIDPVIPLLERIRREGAIVIIKFDGQRRDEADNGPYTAMISSRRLRDETLRIDAHSIEDAVAQVIAGYARECWGFQS